MKRDPGLPLPVVKPTRVPHQPELKVAASLLAERFAASCHTRRCVGACCRSGVWLDIAHRDLILAHADRVREAMDPGQPRNTHRWFSRRVTRDPDFATGWAIHTRVRHGACVFLNRAGRCVLQSASEAAGGGVELKPFFCTAFPVTIVNGVLTLDDADFREGHPCCEATSGGRRTVFDVCAMELRHVLGPAGVSRLRRIAARRRRPVRRAPS